MKLIKLDENQYKSIVGKRIICYVKAIDYIQYMDEKYNCINMVEAIIEDYEKRRQNCVINGKMICVYERKYLESIDWNSHILVITSDYFWEVFESLSSEEKLSKEIDTVYYFLNKNSEYYESYVSMYKDRELEKYIIFRSGPKLETKDNLWDFSDNTRALFEYMVDNGLYKKYKLVWIVKDVQWVKNNNIYPNEVEYIPEEWAVSEKKEERDCYYHYLCLAEYIFFDNADSFARMARKDQIRVQLWHGQGFKGRVLGPKMGKRCSYMPVMSEKYAEIHEKIFGLDKQQLLITGIPKQDWCFRKVNRKMLLTLGIPSNTKYIFWLPTWRKAEGNDRSCMKITETDWCSIDICEEQWENLNFFLKEKNTCMIIKLHPVQKVSNRIKMSNVVFLDENEMADLHIHINQLLGYADAIISDYSSVITDYMLLDRPIGLAVGDKQEYADGLGFVLNPIDEWLPGKVILSFNDLFDFCEQITRGIDSSKKKRHQVAAVLCKYRDDNNCKRLLEALQFFKN